MKWKLISTIRKVKVFHIRLVTPFQLINKKWFQLEEKVFLLSTIFPHLNISVRWEKLSIT